MAWVIVKLHIAMANGAAPWLGVMAMTGIWMFCILWCTSGESR